MQTNTSNYRYLIAIALPYNVREDQAVSAPLVKKIFSCDMAPLCGGHTSPRVYDRLINSILLCKGHPKKDMSYPAVLSKAVSEKKWDKVCTLPNEPVTTSWQTVYTYHGFSRSAGFLWLEGTFPWVQEPSWWHELHTMPPVNTEEDTQWRKCPNFE